jgi:glycosyltransferase involved in cell wall biosynthesis
LRLKYPRFLYEIIDDGPQRSHLAALAQELGIAERVKFHGRQNRRFVAEAMKRCTIFALPSTDEAMGCVYLEAMATAKPIIGCRGQGIEEIVHHGENGRLIQPDNLQEMVQALDILLANAPLRERMGMKARQTITEGLTLQHQAARLSALYRECLGLADHS